MRDIVLVFDDVQWMDEISMDIIKAVIKGAGKHFLVLSTRPQNILDSLGFDQNNSLSIKTANITLNGLALEDVNEFLISRFSSLGVESVDQELVKVMHSKCEGSPLNLQMMVQYLKSDECLKVSENVLGLVPEKAPIIQSLLERGLSQTIMSQFDKLHGGLRDLLERASIFGQHFDLNDVKNLSEESPNILSMRRLILERDTCEFVVCSEFDPTTTTLFSFRHAAIAATIYSTMSFSERSKLHRIAGENYEATISEKNREMLLPLLVYHYSLSDCHLKYIDFVEELSMYYMKRGFHAECRILIRELIEFVTANESSNLAPDNKRLASWYAALALSASTDFQLETVKTAAVTALLLIGRQFPLTEQEVPHYILKSLFRHLWLLMTKPPKRSITRAKKSNIHNEDITDMALFSLHYVFLGAGESIPDAYKLVTLLELLNEAIIIAGQEPAKWAVRAFQAAFAVRLVSMPISRYYYSSALLATTKCEEHEFLHAFPMFLALLIADNKYEEAVRMNEVFINIARQKAEVGMIQSSTNYAYLLRMHNSPQESLSLMLQQLDEAVVQDIYVSDNSVYNMMEIAIYARDMKKIRESLERTQELRQRLLNKSVAYKENRQAQIQVIVGELWISLFESKINDALEHVKELGSFVQSISAISHFFTAFTLGFFGVWVLITLIDTQDANVIAKKRLILSSHLEIPRKKLSAISRNHMPTQDFQTLFQAAHLLLKGSEGRRLSRHGSY
ncbi:hypothetical protein BC829DRAFT_185111 [Chytridium lagenaria]|nr:hypothetical protein BC829DRAFT_185111 [Chytridium lagenaria]